MTLLVSVCSPAPFTPDPTYTDDDADEGKGYEDRGGDDAAALAGCPGGPGCGGRDEDDFCAGVGGCRGRWV